MFQFKRKARGLWTRSVTSKLDSVVTSYLVVVLHFLSKMQDKEREEILKNNIVFSLGISRLIDQMSATKR